MAVTLANPIESRTTPYIDRASRLLSLRGHPGFGDLVALSQETVNIARAALVNFEGWDKDELVARSIAYRAAEKSHEMLFVRLAQAIQTGIEEASAVRDAAIPANQYSKEAADMSDELRAQVIQQIDQSNYETRTPGSY